MSAVLSRRYARAIFDIARRRGDAVALQDQLDAVAGAAEVCPDLPMVLANNEISLLRRERLIDALAERLALAPITGNFLKVLVAKRRVPLLAGIVAAYRQLVADMEGIVAAEVTTSLPMTDERDMQAIASAVSQLTRRKAVVSMRVDPALVGGMVVRVGDEIYDGSVRTELKRMREQLLHI